jgi:arsenate reductase
MAVEIWHNPRCSKSRQTLALLEEKGVAADVVEYLNKAPTQKRLKEVAAMLGVVPREMMRKGEAVYKELGLKEASDAALFKAMAANPILIERPIVIKGKKAAIGRPPESVLDIL